MSTVKRTIYKPDKNQQSEPIVLYVRAKDLVATQMPQCPYCAVAFVFMAPPSHSKNTLNVFRGENPTNLQHRVRRIIFL